MIEREDGPIKHYFMICDTCKKKTRRQPGDFFFEEYEQKGWSEVEDDGWHGNKHYCPACSTGKPAGKTIKEIIPEAGDGEQLSDHEEADVPLKRVNDNQLVIDLGVGGKIFISSDTEIIVEHHEE